LLGLLIGTCCCHRAIETRLHEERKCLKKLQKDMKEVKKALYPNNTPSPPGSEERECNPPTPFEQRYANYENFDPSQLFAPYTSQAFDAPPPPSPLEHQGPSMVDHLAADLFGDPNPCMANSSHTSLPHTNMPPFLTRPCTPGQDHIGLHRMITPWQMITRRQGLKLLRTPFIFFLDDC
jgi:hypothetical protein